MPRRSTTLFVPDRVTWDYHVIGCGGVGARLVPMMTKILRPGERITLWDDGIVEERNLLRQNFAPQDVGKYKSEVLARRYGTDAIPISAIVRRWCGDSDCVPEAALYLGCVDSRASRKIIYDESGCARVWIDGGCDWRVGQVVLTAVACGTLMSTLRKSRGFVSILGMDALPQLLDASLDDGDIQQQGCAFQPDTQTVAGNVMVASVMLNVLQAFTKGLPLSSCVWLLDTANSIEALRWRVVGRGTRLRPSLKYAMRAAP